MKLEATPAERNLGIQWAAATIVGWGIGFFVCEGLKPFFYDITHLGGDGLIIGAGIGIVQGLVIRRRIASMRWWLLATIVGFGLGKFIGEGVVQGMPAVVGTGLAGAIIGASVGLAQWLVLRRHLTRAEAWVLANVAGWTVGWSLIGLVEESSWSTVMVYAVGGVGAGLAGIITAVALTWVSRGQKPAA